MKENEMNSSLISKQKQAAAYISKNENNFESKDNIQTLKEERNTNTSNKSNNSKKNKDIEDSQKNENYDNVTGEIRIIPDRMHISRNKRYLLFCLFMLTSLFLNFDHGTIPAAIEELKLDLDINETKIGTLGALVYMGTAAGALFLSVIINKINRKKMVALSFFLSGIFIYTFILVKKIWYLYVNRFCVGFTQSLISIYIPIWIDQYSPLKYKTIFMAIFAISAAFGLIVGYEFTVLIKDKYGVRIFYMINILTFALY